MSARQYARYNKSYRPTREKIRVFQSPGMIASSLKDSDNATMDLYHCSQLQNAAMSYRISETLVWRSFGDPPYSVHNYFVTDKFKSSRNDIRYQRCCTRLTCCNVSVEYDLTVTARQAYMVLDDRGHECYICSTYKYKIQKLCLWRLQVESLKQKQAHTLLGAGGLQRHTFIHIHTQSGSTPK
jgi:hypothetical protein